MRVKHEHMRALGYCNRGLRRWFAERGIIWADFLRDGVDPEVLRASGDAMAIAAVELAERGLPDDAGDQRQGGCV